MARHLELQLRGVDAGVAGVYSPAGSELDVGPATEALVALGWTLAWPRVVAGHERLRGLEFAVASTGGLRPGYRGILEPPASAAAVVVDELALLLVPGLGFDRLGQRLGQGGGFYDRVLSAPARPPAWGIAFALQVLPALPTEPWDRRVDRVITERGVSVDGVWSLL